jgi:hypothetical protein
VMPPARVKRVFLVVRGDRYLAKTAGGMHWWTARRDAAQVFQYPQAAASAAQVYGGYVREERGAE